MSTPAEAEQRAQERGRCGFCVGYKPGYPQPTVKSEGITQCPCCFQYASVLYKGPCVSHHVGYGTQA